MENPLSARTALLAALISGPGYGLELVDRVRERTNGKVRMGQGSIYPAIQGLERDGLVRSWDGETVEARRGRPRRYYEITAEGKRALAAESRAVFGLLRPLGAT